MYSLKAEGQLYTLTERVSGWLPELSCGLLSTSSSLSPSPHHHNHHLRHHHHTPPSSPCISVLICRPAPLDHRKHSLGIQNMTIAVLFIAGAWTIVHSSWLSFSVIIHLPHLPDKAFGAVIYTQNPSLALPSPSLSPLSCYSLFLATVWISWRRLFNSNHKTGLLDEALSDKRVIRSDSWTSRQSYFFYFFCALFHIARSSSIASNRLTQGGLW